MTEKDEANTPPPAVTAEDVAQQWSSDIQQARSALPAYKPTAPPETQGSLEAQPWDATDWTNWRSFQTKLSHDHDRDLGAALEGIQSILDLLEDVGPGGPLHWELMQPVARAELLAKLADFVAFLDRTYLRVSQLTLMPCWWRHPDVVWHLTALMVAFHEAYNPKARIGMTQVAFHEQALWPTLQRINSLDSMHECNRENHGVKSYRSVVQSPALVAQIEKWNEGDDTSITDLYKDAAAPVPDGPSGTVPNGVLNSGSAGLSDVPPDVASE